MKPGMPTLFSVYKDTPILSLSGNPFGAVVSADVLIRPMVQKMTQDPGLDTIRKKCTLTNEFGKKIKGRLENKIATLTGGRAAEEVVFHSITTGASNDIEQATKLARAMLTRYGMSDEFDMVALETVNNQYLGGDTSLACSAQTQCEIDQKVVELVKAQHAKAVQILTDNRAKLHKAFSC